MVRVGGHVSISGGVSNAVSRQTELGGTCGQIFVGSPRGWSVSDIDSEEAAAFQAETKEQDIGPWIVHGTYLINLATPKDDLAEKSIATVQGELEACAALDIPYYVFHPGSHTGAGAETGVENVGERLSELHIPDSTKVLLENTAGKGTTVGRSFEELARMVEVSDYGYESLGFCLDSCHLFAAGYDFRTKEAMEELLREVETHLGVENVEYLHLNDSKHPFESEKDEHEHIGEGEIGDDGFRHFVNHDAFSNLPMVLETPEDEKGYEWNINRIRELAEEDSA